MPATALLSLPLPTPLAPSRRSAPPPVVSVFLPKEHGSWSLALEPLALGLLVAPSWAGGALAVVALTGFFARRPLKTLLSASPDPLRRPRARQALALFAALALIGLLETLVLRGLAPLWPLLLALPFGGLFLVFDAKGAARAAAAELAGCATFSCLPATLATLAGWPAWAALALAATSLARSVPTVLTVRTSLRLAKHESTHVSLTLVVAFVATASLTALAGLRLLPWLAVLPAWLLLARSAWLVSAWRPAWPARRIGQLEAALGLLTLVVVTLAYQHR